LARSHFSVLNYFINQFLILPHPTFASLRFPAVGVPE